MKSSYYFKNSYYIKLNEKGQFRKKKEYFSGFIQDSGINNSLARLEAKNNFEKNNKNNILGLDSKISSSRKSSGKRSGSSNSPSKISRSGSAGSRNNECKKYEKSKIVSSLKIRPNYKGSESLLKVKNIIDKNSLFKIENYYKERGML